MKEVTCICGEQIVFLDDEIKVKTCPNCGMSVYREEISYEPLLKKRTRSKLPRRQLVIVGAAAAGVLVALGLVTLFSSMRGRALTRADALVKSAEGAVGRGELFDAEAAYARALRTYRSWWGPPGRAASVESALDDVRLKIALAALPDEKKEGMLLGMSPEEIARQAYNSAPEAWQETFSRLGAGRTLVLAGTVEERSGGPYAAASLTVSYHIFNSSGREVEFLFDPPFFPRYRMKSGDACIVNAVLSRMYLEAGPAGGEAHWVLVADGDKSTLLTDTSILKGLGWKVDDETENLAALQSSLSPAY